MNRFILLAFVVQCLCASIAIADDYLLRLDTIGYVDRPAAEKHPKETVLRSIEVVARPGSVFHGKVRVGTVQTLTLTGKLSPADKGGFTLLIRYVHSIDSGVTVLTEDGKRKPLLDTTAFHTTIAISLGDPVTIAGASSKTSQFGKPKVKSKTRYVFRLSKYELPDD